MDQLLALMALLLLISAVFIFALFIKNFDLARDKRTAFEIANRLQTQIDELKPTAAKETLTVEAQQILHDLTMHGQSIVRIVPLSPTDVFWKSPR